MLQKKTFYPSVGYLLVCLVWMSWSSPCITETRCVEWDTAGVCVRSEASSGDYGCPFAGKFKNVTAYSNGGWTGSGIGRDSLQCVGLAKRFYRDFFRDTINQAVGSADSFYTGFVDRNLKRFGLEIFPNSGNVAPRIGDMVIFGGGGYGHVAIYCGIGSDGKVQIFEQNIKSPTAPFRGKDYSVNNGAYTIVGSTSYPVLGWLHLAVGSYADGFHLDTTGNALDWTSKAFIDAFNDQPSYSVNDQSWKTIGWPTNHRVAGGTKDVYTWLGQTNSSFGVVAQDFIQDNLSLPHYGDDGKSVLILNDLEGAKEVHQVSGGIFGYYRTHDGPYNYGVPYTDEIQGPYANSHLVLPGDSIQPVANCTDPNCTNAKLITVQKFKRRLANGTYYNEQRRTLVYNPDGPANDPNYNVCRFPVGEFSIGGYCSLVNGVYQEEDGVQWYIQGVTPAQDIAWPMLGVKTPTGKWFTKPGTYNFVRHNAIGGWLMGSGFTANITEGNYQFAGDTTAEVIQPGNLAVSSVDANSVMLAWNMGLNSSSNVKYYIYRSLNSSFGSAIKIDSTLNTYYTDDGLVEGEGFNYWVKASIGGQLSECSNSVYAVTAASHGDGTLPNPPTNLSFVFTSSTSVKVSWNHGDNNPNNVLYYQLKKAVCGYGPMYCPALVCATTPYEFQEVTGLSPDSTYYFWVELVTKDNFASVTQSSVSVVMANYVYPPQNLVAASSNGAIILSWASQMANVNFKVYRSTSASFPYQELIQTSGALSCLDTTGQSGRTFYYRVCAFSSTTTSSYSNAVSAIPLPFLPPDSFRAVSVESNRVKLAWERSPGTIYNYWVSRYLNGVQQWSYSVTDTSFVDYTVVQGETYSYKIQARSNLLSAVSDGLIISVPLKKAYSDFTYLSDVDSNGYAEIAGLYKKGDDSVIVSIVDIGNNQVLQSFHFGNYQPNSLAEVRANEQLKLIVALDSLGADTTTLFKVVDVGINRQTFVLYAPVNFQTGEISYGQISLNWGRSGNPDNLGVQYCLYASQGNDLSSAQFIGSTSGTSYVHEGLSAGGSWHYWLKSIIGLESSSFVGPISASTNSLLAPANVVVRQVLTSKVVLEWASVSGANGYNVYRDGSFAGYVAADSFVDMSVGPNNQYLYQVASVFNSYYSSPTDALSVHTAYAYLSVFNPIKDVRDIEFLPDIDNDSLPEMAILGTDTVTNAPTIVVRKIDDSRVLAQIPFFNAYSVPLYFTPTYLGSNSMPAFTVMGTVADSVKLQTKSFFGTQF